MAGTAGSGPRSNSDGERIPFHQGTVVMWPPAALVARALRSRVSMNACDRTTGQDGIAN